MIDSGCKSGEEECKEQIYHCDNTSGYSFHPALYVRAISKRNSSLILHVQRKEVHYETEECGSILWDRKKNEVTLCDRKNKGAVRDKKELYL